MRLLTREEWRQRAVDLNHTWIAQYHTRIQVILKLIRNGNLLDARLSQFWDSDFVAWIPRGEEYRGLTDLYEKVYSPAALFYRPPLVNCPYESEVWLREIAHVLWQTRWHVTDKLDDCRAALSYASKLYGDIVMQKGYYSESDSAEWSRCAASDLASFDKACLKLSAAFSILSRIEMS